MFRLSLFSLFGVCFVRVFPCVCLCFFLLVSVFCEIVFFVLCVCICL